VELGAKAVNKVSVVLRGASFFQSLQGRDYSTQLFSLLTKM